MSTCQTDSTISVPNSRERQPSVGRIYRLARVLTTVAIAGTFAVSSTTAATAAGSDTLVVFPDGFSDQNVSADRPTAIWDGSGFAKFTGLPESGSKWVLDIENKQPGTWGIDGNGLTIALPEEDMEASTASKVRLQYYVGTGGFPAIDETAPVLADLFDDPFSWEQEQLEGDPNYGVTLEVQLEKEVSEGEYDRVTVVSRWDASPNVRNFGEGLWWANDPAPGTGLGQWAGVDAGELLAEYGDFDVVSFGPNLGSGWNESTRIQDFSILGQTFHFVPAKPSDPVEPADPQSFDESLELDESAFTSTGSTDGQSVTLNLGTDFANQWVSIVLHSAPTNLGWFFANSNGVITFNVPSSVPSGSHTIAVHDISGTVTGYATGLVVLAAEPVGDEILPVTGGEGEAWFTAATASGLLLVGLAMLLIRFRRSARA